MKKRGLLLIIAGLMYIIAVIAGGFMVENYNHIYNAISELSEKGQNKVLFIEISFIIYNILIVIYSFISIMYKRKNLLINIVYILLGLIGLSGIFMGIFPQEARDSELTIVGIMHFIFAGIAAFATMAVALITFFNYIKKEKNYAFYSLITFIIIFISGISNVILMNNNIDSFFGLVERITIGSFIIWLIVTGYRDLKSNS